MKIKDIAIFNPENISSNVKHINYIDTSSSFDGVINSHEYLTKPFPSRAQRLIKENDILISSVRPNLLHNAIVTNKHNNFVASTGYIHIRPDAKLINPKYLFYLLNSDNFVKYYCSVADTSQSSYPSINKDLIENISIKIPPITKQFHIVDIM